MAIRITQVLFVMLFLARDRALRSQSGPAEFPDTSLTDSEGDLSEVGFGSPSWLVFRMNVRVETVIGLSLNKAELDPRHCERN